MTEIYCDRCGQKSDLYQKFQLNLENGKKKLAVTPVEHQFCLGCAREILIKIERECIGEIKRDIEEAERRSKRITA